MAIRYYDPSNGAGKTRPYAELREKWGNDEVLKRRAEIKCRCGGKEVMISTSRRASEP